MTDLEKDKRLAWLETELKSLKQDYENCARTHRYDAQSMANKIASLLCRSRDANIDCLLMRYQAADVAARDCTEFSKYIEAILEGKSIVE